MSLGFVEPWLVRLTKIVPGVFRPSFVLKIDKLEAIRTVVFLMNIHKYLKFQYF